MDELSIFIEKINKISSSFSDTQMTIIQAREIVQEINEFLYTNYVGIGATIEFDEQFPFLSDFHRYWHDNYKNILNIQIDETQCKKVAEALHGIYIKTNGTAFKEIYDTAGLSKEDICRVRLLTANQDFRGSRSFSELAKTFKSDKSIFDEEKIFEDPATFIKSIGITGLSQNDKRVLYAKNISKFLIDLKTSPFGLIDKFDRDVYKLREAIIELIGSGYGYKKADMLIRDMVVLDVWDDVKNFDKINVASDVNTIKVALRTGIIKSEIPLVSSFIDIFCYQYGYVDEMNAKAWRTVWQNWNELFPTECISSPCLIDFFVYNVVGKQFCKEILCFFKCDKYGHEFKWHSARNKTCQICYNNGLKHEKATLIAKIMPCLDTDGNISIRETEFIINNPSLKDFSSCPFESICLDNKSTFLQPPKSISIKGQTGWTTAYAKKGEGGGGLMA
jgi:glutaredoxin-related protein